MGSNDIGCPYDYSLWIIAMMDKNDIRQLITIEQLDKLTIRKVSIDKLLETDMTYDQMSKVTGMSVYEIRRYTGSIQ